MFANVLRLIQASQKAVTEDQYLNFSLGKVKVNVEIHVINGDKRD